jgi:hypothetical protein
MSLAAHAGPSRAGRNPSFDVDAEFLALMAQLSLQDIEEIERQQRHVARAGRPLSDAELALTLFAEEARASIMFNNDRAFAQALQAAEPQLAGQA